MRLSSRARSKGSCSAKRTWLSGVFSEFLPTVLEFDVAYCACCGWSGGEMKQKHPTTPRKRPQAPSGIFMATPELSESLNTFTNKPISLARRKRVPKPECASNTPCHHNLCVAVLHDVRSRILHDILGPGRICCSRVSDIWENHFHSKARAKTQRRYNGFPSIYMSTVFGLNLSMMDRVQGPSRSGKKMSNITLRESSKASFMSKRSSSVSCW